MLRIAICDDSLEEAVQLQRLLEQYQGIHPEQELLAQTFTSAEQLLLYQVDHPEFDVYFLDVIMPGMDGITVARQLRSQGNHGIIIYLTSSKDYAFDAFQVHAMQYLLKPTQQDALFPVIDQAAHLLDRRPARRLPIHTTAGTIQIHLSALAYVECIRHVLCFHLANGQTLTSRSIRVPFVEAVAPLLADRCFLHAHKSFILNMSHVSQLGQDAFQMCDGAVIPVPKKKLAAVRSAYLDFLSSGALPLEEMR